MKKTSVAILIIAFLVIPACSFLKATPQTNQSQVSTIVAATLQALPPTQAAPVQAQATQTAQPSGISVSYENISIIIPNGLAANATGETFPAMPADSMAGGLPAYSSLTLNSYPMQDTRMQPEISVFPTDEYRQRDQNIRESMDAMTTVLSDPNASLDNLPVLPLQMAARLFQAQTQRINFQNGSGIRYLTQFAQYPAIVSNQEMFYNFIGLTRDGKYFINATLPVSAAFLQADSNPQTALPADGIPYPSSGDALPSNDEANTYYSAIALKLNATDPSAFAPTLTTLDALIQSIQVQ